MKKQLTAAFLIVFLSCTTLLSGCAGLYNKMLRSLESSLQEDAPSFSYEPSASPSASLPPLDLAGSRVVPFSDMEYIRPDAPAITDRLNEIADLLWEDAVDAVMLKELIDEADRLYDQFSTMDTLASIHSDMDQSSEDWAEEMQYTSQHFSEVSMAYDNYSSALYNSSYKEQIEEQWDPHYFDTLGDTIWYTQETIPVYQKEADLVNQYGSILATQTISYDGQELTLADAESLADYDSYQEASALWYQTYNPVLGEIYVDLVKTRNELAQSLGFDHYIDMAFQDNLLDYSPDMARALLNDIATYASPVYSELNEYGTAYPVDVDSDYADFSAFVQQTLDAMDSGMSNSFRMMNEYGLSDLEPRLNKSPGAYTTYLTSYDAPFLMMSYDGSGDSMFTLIHEFGHFNAFSVSHDEWLESTDTSEIFSQALELMFARYYEDFFGEETGYYLNYNALSRSFSTFPEQAFYSAMELEVYSLDPQNVTLENINQIAKEQAQRFGLNPQGDESADYLFWIGTPHLFQQPFYVFSYVTSMDIALQLWEISLTDEAQAMVLYNQLLAREESTEFLENVQAAGLESPFEAGRMQHVAALAQKYLLEEDWSLEEEQTAA